MTHRHRTCPSTPASSANDFSTVHCIDAAVFLLDSAEAVLQTDDLRVGCREFKFRPYWNQYHRSWKMVARVSQPTAEWFRTFLALVAPHCRVQCYYAEVARDIITASTEQSRALQ